LDEDQTVTTVINKRAMITKAINYIVKEVLLSKGYGENDCSYVLARSKNTENDREALKIITEKTKILMSVIDDMFGEDACKKIFGNIVPSGFAIAEFVEQLVPIFDNYTNTRQKKISGKYSRNRKGGHKSYYKGKKAYK
jgi:hypothetical protein